MMLFLSTVLALAFASPASSFAIKLSLGVPPLQSQRLSHDIPIHPSVASEDGQVSHQKKLALTAALAAAIVFSTPLAALADGKIANRRSSLIVVVPNVHRDLPKPALTFL